MNERDDKAAAIAEFSKCPFVDCNGTIEPGEEACGTCGRIDGESDEWERGN